MATPSVKTVQFVDPRIEPQPDPAYDYIIGPTQNQYYKIPASGKGESAITFNNLTTLGADRAYLDTFEIELGVDIYFESENTFAVAEGEENPLINFPLGPADWTFDSFPFSKCCSKITTNINGGAFFSEPMAYLRAKERYMDPEALARHYTNICPIQKPLLQTESGKSYNKIKTVGEVTELYNPFTPSIIDGGDGPVILMEQNSATPTRFGRGMFNFNQSAEGMKGGFNNAIVRLGPKRADNLGYANYHFCSDTSGNVDREALKYLHVYVTWREPVLCSPFTQRYDADYQRPLYNITSMDLTFEMPTLKNMIRLANYTGNLSFIKDYTIKIRDANLCYQVMTIPPSVTKPLQTIVPYRRFVPYITDFPGTNGKAGSSGITADGGTQTISSGVYTLNEIPTAIWVFCGPSRATLQQGLGDKRELAKDERVGNTDVTVNGNWDSNNLFGYLNHITITMANTTQILDRCQPVDLYRIAVANGCHDSYWSWQLNDTLLPKNTSGEGSIIQTLPKTMYYGAGSVLRLIPGVDLIVPDQALIPGANANNMVFQCTADFTIPPHAANLNNYSLWLLFEYVGVASISPGQCEITMNPLGSGDIMAVSPIMSATNDKSEGVIGGSGFWDRAKRGAEIAAHIAKTGILSRILRNVPGMEQTADWLASKGYGEPAAKRKRGGAVRGGAVMGMEEWM